MLVQYAIFSVCFCIFNLLTAGSASLYMAFLCIMSSTWANEGKREKLKTIPVWHK